MNAAGTDGSQMPAGRGPLDVPMPADLAGIDGRTRPARRWRRIVLDVVSDSGGPSECSAVRRALIGRFAAACVLTEQIEERVLRGEAVDVDTFVRLTGAVARLGARLGLNRRARKVESLSDILDSAAAQQSDEEA